MKAYRNLALPLLPLLLAAACGVSETSPDLNGGINQNETIMPDGSNVEGMYAGELWPVNHNLAFKAVGAAGVQRDGDTFKVMVRLKYGSRPNVEHKQAIYTGRRCPTLKDDLNKDAYIDINEAKAAIGEVTIPLDSNIDSQAAGRGDFPNGGTTGKYFYQASASFDRMFTDLKIPDENPYDNVIKLPQQGGLTFPGRVLVLQGLSEKIWLPKTVGSMGVDDPHETIPVACAVLWKVDKLPADLKPE